MSNKYEDLIKSARMNADCGEHMSPAEVTTLLNVVETTFAALAGENAGLKAAHPQPFGPVMMKALDAYEKHQDETPETGMLDAFFILRDSIRVDTTATDAFLAEVRAQGVEEFLKGSQLPYQIATVLADYDNVDDATLQTVIWSGQPPEPDGDVWHLEYVSRGNAIVRAVLKQLRQEAK